MLLIDSSLTWINGYVCVQLYITEGPSAFFRGFSPAFVRSIPANAMAFLVYETVREAMQ